MKTFKRLTFSIDGCIIHTTPVTLPENGDDCECPACLNKKWQDRYSIVQYGFAKESHIDIIECSSCGNFYHVQYEVEVEYASISLTVSQGKE